MTTSDAQGDLTRNPETVNHTSNGNETVTTHTSNGNFEQKIWSNRTIPVVVPTMKPSIEQRIAPIVAVPQTLFTPETKEVVVDAASGGTWVNRTPRIVNRTGIYGITPDEICNAVIVEHSPSPVPIGIFSTSPPCVLNRSLHFANKRQSTSPGLGGNTQKLDAVVDGKLPNYLYSASIFSKVIGHKLSDSSSGDLYLRCRMNLAGDVFQIQTPQFMDLGILTINNFYESSVLRTPATRI